MIARPLDREALLRLVPWLSAAAMLVPFLFAGFFFDDVYNSVLRGELLTRTAVGEEGVVGDIGNVHRGQAGFFPLQIVHEVPGPERAEERLRGAFADRIPIAAA